MKPRDPNGPRTPSGATPIVRMTPVADQCRCACGTMLARVVAQGLELKCRKCKSLVLISHQELVDMYQGLDFGHTPFMPVRGPRDTPSR